MKGGVEDYTRDRFSMRVLVTSDEIKYVGSHEVLLDRIRKFFSTVEDLGKDVIISLECRILDDKAPEKDPKEIYPPRFISSNN